MKLKGVYLGFARTVARETQIQEALELCCRPLDYKMGLGGNPYKGKNHKVTISYMSCLSGIIIGAGKK